MIVGLIGMMLIIVLVFRISLSLHQN